MPCMGIYTCTFTSKTMNAKAKAKASGIPYTRYAGMLLESDVARSQ